jgi:predicted nucleic acid-binding protein
LRESKSEIVRESPHQERLAVELIQETLNVLRRYRLQSRASLSSLVRDVRGGSHVLVTSNHRLTHSGRTAMRRALGQNTSGFIRLHQTKIWHY